MYSSADYTGYLQAEIAMRADGKPGMSDEEVCLRYKDYSSKLKEN